MMKKLIALLLVFLLPLCALAEMDEDGNVLIALDGAEIFFTPAEGSICLTRESSASVFNRLGLSQRETVPWMEEYDVYALLCDDALATEIQVIITPTADVDYDELSAQALEMNCDGTEKYYISQGYDVTSVDVYHTPTGHSYVCTVASYTYEDGYVEHMAEFFTCQSGYTVFVVIFPYEGGLTEQQMRPCMDMVDSLRVSELAVY